MAKVSICDCCKKNRADGAFVMDADGIHEPHPVQRQGGFMPIKSVDLCESCSTSLRFHWGKNAESGGAR